MALAGAERIFDLMDEEPEEDDGYVTLVNAEEDADGSLTEAQERTGIWAWKHPHQADGTVTYTQAGGRCASLTMWTFGYDDGQDRPARYQPVCRARARRSPLSAPPVRARPPSPT